MHLARFGYKRLADPDRRTRKVGSLHQYIRARKSFNDYRGTSTIEGLGIAHAIAESLIDLGVRKPDLSPLLLTETIP